MPSPHALLRKRKSARTTRPSRRFGLNGFGLTLEPLENRLVLAVFNVNTTADSVDVNPGDGIAQDASGLTSLRAAVMEADALGGPSEIILPAGTYLLTIAGSLNASAASGDLDLTCPITIVGAGAAATIIDAHGLGDRVFDVSAGAAANPLAVSLSDLTVTGGTAPDSSSLPTSEDDGGGMRLGAYTVATIDSCVFSDNRAPQAAGYGQGGAISSSGALVIRNSRFEQNSASNSGGAIFQGESLASATIQDTTFDGNQATNAGGAIDSSTSLTIDRSTFSNNVARNSAGNLGHGGAIDSWSGCMLSLTNSTLSGNQSVYGGAISNYGGFIIQSSTIAGNQAYEGGGFYGGGSNAKFENSIIAENSATFFGADLVDSFVSLGHNIVSSTAGNSGFGAVGDLLNVDPMLAPLADNGGPTQTRALLVGSPAIDAANPLTAPAVDQRGVARPFGAGPDIGAFEYNTPLNTPPVAKNDNAATQQGASVVIAVLANDSDPDGDSLSVVSVGSPAHGTATINVDGTVTYLPQSAFHGSDSFTYTIDDGHGHTAVGSVTIGVNAPPVATAHSYQVQENNMLSVSAAGGVLANDSDPDGDLLSVAIAAPPAHGALTLNTDGSFSYAPFANYFGQDSFTYTASDGNGGASTGRVTIDVNPQVAAAVFSVHPKQINLASRGVITVELFSTPTFDAAQADVQSIRFAGAAPVRSELSDVNDDGRLDLVLHFNVQSTDLLSSYVSLLNSDLQRTGSVGSAHRTVSAEFSGALSGGRTFDAFGNANVFLAGEAFGDLAANLKGGSAANDLYVIAVYREILARNPSIDELQIWARLLKSGISREAFVNAVDHSDEYYATIIRPAYEKYFGRDADDSGIAYWTSQMRAGLTDEQLEAKFIASDEFYRQAGGNDRGWVDSLYEHLLGRGADAQGEEFWVRRLHAGQRRYDAAFGFTGSLEREAQRIQGDYQQFLGRSADGQGIGYWVVQFARGLTNELLITGFAASDEYFRAHSN